MKFSDILALAKQGYTPADIRELMAISNEEQQQETATVSTPEQEQEQSAEVAPINVPEETVQSTVQQEQGNAEKITALEAEIARLKAENTRIAQPAKPQEKSPQEKLNDLARGFM